MLFCNNFFAEDEKSLVLTFLLMVAVWKSTATKIMRLIIFYIGWVVSRGGHNFVSFLPHNAMLAQYMLSSVRYKLALYKNG